MNIKEFMDLFELKNIKTVKGWLENGFIIGAIKDENGVWNIPDLARPPYTKARAKNTISIYSSIVEACIHRKSVCAKLYKINENEFKEYILNLQKEGFISIKVVDDIEYYFATTKSEMYLNNKEGLKKHLKSIYQTTLEAVVQGVTKTVIEHVQKSMIG